MSFIDTTIVKIGDHLMSRVYTEPTNTLRYYESHHTPKCKRDLLVNSSWWDVIAQMTLSMQNLKVHLVGATIQYPPPNPGTQGRVMSNYCKACERLRCSVCSRIIRKRDITTSYIGDGQKWSFFLFFYSADSSAYLYVMLTTLQHPYCPLYTP